MNCLPSRFISEIPDEYISITENVKPIKIKGIFKVKSQKSNEYNIGEIVIHKVFGKGKIRNIEGIGGEAKFTILFSGNITKKFMAKYANLSKV